MANSLNFAFDGYHAQEYGVDCAVLIFHFRHWIHANKRRKANFHDGRTWSYQTFSDLVAHFPFYTKRQIEKILSKLIDSGVLIKGNYNQTKFDRTMWYAFADESKFCNWDKLVPLEPDEEKKPESEPIIEEKIAKSQNVKSISPNGEMDCTERGNPKHQTVKSYKDKDNIPDNRPYKSNSASAQARPPAAARPRDQSPIFKNAGDAAIASAFASAFSSEKGKKLNEEETEELLDKIKTEFRFWTLSGIMSESFVVQILEKYQKQLIHLYECLLKLKSRDTSPTSNVKSHAALLRFFLEKKDKGNSND